MARQTKSEVVQKNRRRRSGNIGKAKQNLAIPPKMLDNTKYVYRWINDQGNRLFKMLREDDWDLVNADDKMVEWNNHFDATESGAMKFQVGKDKDGTPIFAFLARKLREFHEEDKAEAQKAIDEKMNQHRSGEAAKEIGQGYVPSSGIKIS